MIRILVVEDEPNMLETLSEVLTEQGYQVDSASNGPEAINLAQSQVPYDLIVTDVRMEGMDGLATLEQVKLAQPDIRSLVVTGFSNEEDSIRAIRLGAGDWLRKPFPLDLFLQRVGDLLGRRRKDLQRLEAERRLRSTSLWALMSLASLTEAPVAAAGRLAAQLARELGLEPGEAARATLEQGLRQRGIPCLELPELHERFDQRGEQIPLLARVVAVSLAAGRGEELSSGQFDPMLIELLQDCDPEREPDLSSPAPGPHQRSLLSLGRALEESDPTSAARAFQLVLAEGRESREEVQAWLRMAALSTRAGERVAAREHAERAVRLARKLGPAAAGQALLESGLQLGERSWLEESARLQGAAGLEAGAALARLAAMGESEPDPGALEECLSVLLRPENFDELAQCQAWALPRLLELWPLGGAVRSAVLRLVGEGTAPVETLSEAARLHLVQALSGAGGEAGAELVERLARDPAAAVSRAARALRTISRLPVLRIHTLGPFEVFRGEEPVAFKTTRARPSQLKFLLAYLAAHPTVSRDRVAEEFWPDDPTRGKRKLSLHLTLVQQCVEPPDHESGQHYLVRSQESVGFTGDPAPWHDLEEFETSCQEADRLEASGNLEEAARWRLKAGRLYRGAYLEECTMDWALPLRSRAERLALDAFHRLSRHLLKTERPDQAMEWAKRVLELDDCRQEAYLTSMQACLALRQYEEAVRHYETCRRLLKRELDMEPSIELFEAYQRARLSL